MARPFRLLPHDQIFVLSLAIEGYESSQSGSMVATSMVEVERMGWNESRAEVGDLQQASERMASNPGCFTRKEVDTVEGYVDVARDKSKTVDGNFNKGRLVKLLLRVGEM